MLSPYTVVLAPNASIMTGPGTNTIVLGGGIEGATLIDPGSADPKHLEALIAAGDERGRIRRILITHGHPDHVEGAVELAKELGVSIYAYSRIGVPVADEELPESCEIPAGDDTLCALYTPGHRFDHLCFYMQRQRILFAGDLLSGIGTNVIAPPEGDMLDYLNSLRRLQGLDISEVVPGHGPVISDVPAKLREYIDHRMQREQQLITVLSEMPGASISALVKHIYADVDPRLHFLAAQSLEAHLLKLEREQQARRTEEGWLLT